MAEWKQQRNKLANLQLLEGGENESKNATPLVNWLSNAKNKDATKYLPSNVSYELSAFQDFIKARQALMEAELNKILS